MPDIEGIDLTPYAESINGALMAGTPCTLATANAEGAVDVALKGSVMVFDRDHLAYLERSLGLNLDNVRANPHVAILYFNREAATRYVRFFGEAQIFESGDIREEIRNRTVEPERARDPENRGVGVLVRIDRIAEIGKTFIR